jgi:hypothetical protein
LAVFTKLSAVTLPVFLFVSWLKAARVVVNRALLCMAVGCLRDELSVVRISSKVLKASSSPYGLVSFCVVSFQDIFSNIEP